MEDSPEERIGYKIIRGTDIVDLAQAVNSAILDGWSPTGGPMYAPPSMMEMASQSKEHHPFWQALIR